jgi:hypothetical protein
MFVHGCHCRMCQRQSGAAFAVNALIEADRVHQLGGTVEGVSMPSPSGSGQNIYRCPECRIAVWSNYLVLPGGIAEAVHFVRVGTLDDPDTMPPDIHIYTASKQPWFDLPANAMAVEQSYDFTEVWPTESIDRRMALLNAV